MLLQSVEKCSVFFTFVQRCYSMLSMVNIVVQLFVHSAKYPFNHCSACSIFLILKPFPERVGKCDFLLRIPVCDVI